MIGDSPSPEYMEQMITRIVQEELDEVANHYRYGN